MTKFAFASVYEHQINKAKNFFKRKVNKCYNSYYHIYQHSKQSYKITAQQSTAKSARGTSKLVEARHVGCLRHNAVMKGRERCFL